MRISDWSSDVCSSDLDHAQLAARALLDRGAAVFTLEFGHLGGECVIALLQAAVVALLLFDLLRQCAHVAGAAVPEPQPVLQPRHQREQYPRPYPQHPHRSVPSATERKNGMEGKRGS